MPADALTGPYAQQQKLLLYVLPVVFAVGGIAFPIGVLLYWTTSNLWTMGQQFYVIRNNPAPGTPAVKAKEERDAAKAAKHGVAAPRSTEPDDGRPEPRAAGARRRASSRKKQTREQRKKSGGSRSPAARQPEPTDDQRSRRPETSRAVTDQTTETETEHDATTEPDASRRDDRARRGRRDRRGRPSRGRPTRPPRRGRRQPPGRAARARGRHRRRLPRGAARHRRPRRRPGHGRRGRPRGGVDRRRRPAASWSGRDGEVLEALQELTRLAVYRETGERSRLMLDISGYRAEKRARAGGAGRGDRRPGQGDRRAGRRWTRCRRSSARSSTTPWPRPA